MEIRSPLWIFILSCLGTSWAIEPLSVAMTAGAASAIWGYFDGSLCRVMECCDQRSTPTDAKNISALENELSTYVYGQHLMQDIVIRALRGHMESPDPSKALVLSFHGSTGCGKSYVSEFIARSLFAYGMKSKFVKKFVAGIEFPDPTMAAVYKMKVQDKVRAVVKMCERALFIFEDVHLMPSGILDGILPFIDHHTEVDGLDFRKSIFILLSNLGGTAINRKTLELWSAGRQREDVIKLKDFESVIRQGAFNEAGGLYNSVAIKTSLIDHYIPFLPLEEKHVVKCIDNEFKKLGYPSAPEDAAKNILGDMTFMPPEVELYSTSGCKRIASKVSAYVHGKKFVVF